METNWSDSENENENENEPLSTILASLNREYKDASDELVLLTQLCEVLSFSDEDSISTGTSDALSPHLVKLASEEMIPDIALLAIRAMTYLCDSSPRSSLFLVRDNAVSVLCQKLTAIGDMDIAEQCFHALEKISQVQPRACCLAGAIMAVLSFLDFFSTTVQRVALTTVMNICQKLPSEPASLFMDSVPILCNLLQNCEDQKLVEIATVCLIRISKRVLQSPERLAELCRHWFIPSTFRILVRSALPNHVSVELLDVYVTISRRSFEAYETLFQLDISRVMKDNILATSDHSHGTFELIKALLLDSSNEDDQVQLQKEEFLQTRTELVENLGKDVVPLLVNSGGADSYISYGSLCIIKKLICLCSSEFLAELLKSVNISSFLAGLFTRNDPHVLLLALQTSELILEKLSTKLFPSFVREGVLFSIDALSSQDKCQQEPSGSQMETIKCLCYSFDQGNSTQMSRDSCCKLKKDSVYDLAKHIRSSYFASKSSDSDKTLSGVLRELRGFSTKLSDLINDNARCPQHGDMLSGALDRMLAKLNGSEPISNFEFFASGIVKSLVEYFSDSDSLPLEKRVRVFARLFVSSAESMQTLVRKLQSGISSLQTFHDVKQCSSGDIMYVLENLYKINHAIFHLISEDRIEAFAKGKLEDLGTLKISVLSMPQIEFVNAKLTERLQNDMSDSIPKWGSELIESYPFLFSFDARCKYFKLATSGESGREFPRAKFLVSRDCILESASRMIELYGGDDKVNIEVQYKNEVGTGLGPTMEFYTLLSHELQNSRIGMWRDDPSGLFPLPLNEIKLTQVSDKFVLLGQTVARALQDGRVLDMRFSKAFYKLILGKELEIYDVLSFDPGLGRTLIEFTALVSRKEHLESTGVECETLFRGTRIEDLCLDFTLPGYPDFVIGSGRDEEMVTMQNLKEYVSRILDATIGSGISGQVEAFEYGFNKLFPIETLRIFNEEELERLLCGESECWSANELIDHVKFDHGYTATCPPIVNLLEIVAEFDESERRAFLQFVTGAPRLPLGGFRSLNPKLTVVKKPSTEELPSVMTCVNYLKMPPYSSKAVMREKLLYAITEGQGSFHFS